MTDKTPGLVYAHYVGGDRPHIQLKWQDVNAWQPAQGVLWVHLDAASETALN
jgi:hypothetical protein